MGHNSVVLGHPKFTGIPRVDGFSTGPPDLRRHKLLPVCEFGSRQRFSLSRQGFWLCVTT